MLGIVASRNGRSRNGRVRNGRSRIGRSRIGTSTITLCYISALSYNTSTYLKNVNASASYRSE